MRTSSPEHKVTLLVIDVLVFLVAFAAAMHVRFTAQLSWFEFGLPPWEPMLASLPVMLLVWLFTLWACGLYERHKIFFVFARLVQAVLIMSGVLLSVIFFYRGFSYSRGFAGLFLGFLPLGTFAARVAVRVVRARLWIADRSRNRMLLVGRSPAMAHLSVARSDLPFEIAGVLDEEVAVGDTLEELPVLGRPQDLASVAQSEDIRGIIVTDPKLDESEQLSLFEVCLNRNLEWKVVPSVFELMLDRVEVHSAAGIPLLGMRRSNIRGANRIVKRIFDLLVATVALLMVSPLMVLVGLAIKLTSRGPIFFTQTRLGENGRPFHFYKFRSMHVACDDAIHRDYVHRLITQGDAHGEDDKGAVYKIQDDPRLIFMGAFIRKYCIDELPQLFNVLKGDMSLIGPRPPIPYEVEAYREWHKRRFEGPPGITGLWQVSGRNRLSFDEMVKLDIEYLENWSFRTDVEILWRTMGVVLFPDRAY